MQYGLPFLLAMVVTMAWMPAFGRLALKWGIVDRPGLRKVHVAPIARVGGLAMVVGVLIAAIIVIPLGLRERYFLVAGVVLTLFGAADDRFDLDYRIKLLGQLIAASLVVWGGDIQIHSITLDERVMLPQWISVPLTVLFLVGITNAINLADGLDGLAGGTTFLCLAALALLAHSGGQVVCAALALAFAGSVLGFLRFNTFPASVFMGDSGSQLLGFAVGVLSLRATQTSETAVSAATPILLLALPLLDTFSVMAQRIAEGRSPFSPDKNHIHHKLLALGFDHHEAVMIIYIVQGDLFLLAYWMRYESDLTIMGVVTLFFVVSVAMLQGAARNGWRFRAGSTQTADSPLSRLLTTLRKPQNLPRWSVVGVVAGIGGYALISLAEMASLSSDVQILVVGLLAVVIVLLAMRRAQPLSIVEKATLYVTAAVMVYVDAVAGPGHPVLARLSWAAIGLAALGTVLRLRLDTERRFVLTPLDLIVLFVALVVPSLPDNVGVPDGGAAGIAKVVAVFYAIEALVSRIGLGAVWLRIGVAAVLVALSVRPALSL
jgi:UDP-GlcNAc:undecaprenyl-phosphate/decaprenyl-phosphate GlcNAc-1-phosphate transferase